MVKEPQLANPHFTEASGNMRQWERRAEREREWRFGHLWEDLSLLGAIFKSRNLVSC